MGWSNTYYCKRLGVTFKQGDRFIVKGKAYTNAYSSSGVGYDYSNEPSEKVFYGYYTDPTYPDTVKYPIHFTNAEGSRQYYISDDSIYANVSGTLDTFTYSFDANGGTNAPGATKKTHGEKYKFPSTIPTKQGNTFIGWYNNDVNDGKIYGSGEEVSDLPNQNVIWYASWLANQYEIIYKSNTDSGSDKIQVVTYGFSWTTLGRTYSLTGHTQTSWNTRPDGKGVPYSLNSEQTNMQLSDLTLYAIYTPNNYVLTVDPNGGTWKGSTSEQNFEQKYGTTKSIENPTRVGYEFDGWKLNGYGSIKNEIYTYEAGNGELVAQWKRIVLKVTFNASANGGSPNSTKDVYYGDTIGSLPTPSKPFYKFIGWFTKAVGGTQVSSNNVITFNVTYYAQFKIDASVKVKYDGKKVPAIVWLKVNGVWKKCVTWIKDNGKWNKSSGAD